MLWPLLMTSEKRERKGKDCTFWRQFNKQPSINRAAPGEDD